MVIKMMMKFQYLYHYIQYSEKYFSELHLSNVKNSMHMNEIYIIHYKYGYFYGEVLKTYLEDFGDGILRNFE